MTLIYRELPKDPFKGVPPTFLELMDLDTGDMKPDHVWWWSEYLTRNLHETFPETNVGKDPETHEANTPEPEWLAQRMEMINHVLQKLEDAERNLGRTPPVPNLYMRLAWEVTRPQERIGVHNGHLDWVLDELDEGLCHRALATLDKALRADLLGMDAVFAKAEILKKLGDTESAEALRTVAKRISLPSIRQGSMASAKVQYQVWKFKKAYKFIKDSNKVLPDYAEGWYIRGAIEYKLKKDEKAGASFDVSVGIDPGFLLAWFGRGVIHEIDGALALANECFLRSEGP